MAELKAKVDALTNEFNKMLAENIITDSPEPADIFFLMDRSGSMASNLEDAQGGYDTFIKDQAKVPDTNICLWEFDTEHDLVYVLTPADKIPTGKEDKAYKINPRGSTALLDAIMRIIAYAEKHSAKGRKVIVVIQTDGHENMSREATKYTVNDRITKKRAEGWEFIFLGANQDAIAEAEKYGISVESAATYDLDESPVAMAGAVSMMTRGREGKSYAFSDGARRTFRSSN